MDEARDFQQEPETMILTGHSFFDPSAWYSMRYTGLYYEAQNTR